MISVSRFTRRFSERLPKMVRHGPRRPGCSTGRAVESSCRDRTEDDVSRITCPLCTANRVFPLYDDKWRDYFRCVACQLTFVPPAFHLSPSDEKAVYDLHQNSSADQGYRNFLSRIFEPVHARIAPGSHGLDFGSGPGPTLSVMFEEVGPGQLIHEWRVVS